MKKIKETKTTIEQLLARKILDFSKDRELTVSTNGDKIYKLKLRVYK